MLETTLTSTWLDMGTPSTESQSFPIDELLAAMMKRHELDPEKKLMLAVLKDAIDCLRGVEASPARRARLARDARDWFWDKKDYGFFSFDNVCEMLGLDRQAVRYALDLTDRSKNHNRRWRVYTDPFHI